MRGVIMASNHLGPWKHGREETPWKHPRLAFWTSRLSQVLLPAFWVPPLFVVQIPREPVRVNEWRLTTTDKNSQVLGYIVSALVIRCTGDECFSLRLVLMTGGRLTALKIRCFSKAWGCWSEKEAQP